MAGAKENKVRFNLKNVHYAVLSEADDGTITYATPVSVPGAVNLSLDPQGDLNEFYADGISYFQSIADNGYSGDLEMARFPDQMLQDIWAQTLTATSKILVENINNEIKHFALLFQIDGDQNNDYYVMYNCIGTRPAIASTTNTETKEPQTQSSTISAKPLSSGKVMARTTKDTPESTKTDWFTAVVTDET